MITLVETLDIDFTIKSICENGDLSKIYTSKVHIKNPFLTEEYEDIKDLLVYSIKEFWLWKEKECDFNRIGYLHKYNNINYIFILS